MSEVRVEGEFPSNLNRKFNYERQWAFIRFIGTHKEYDNINSETF
jgi:mRNA-degrading endonuclease HigB of HigAB toxin-antitoxin module